MDIGLRLVGADSPGPTRLIRAARHTPARTLGATDHVFLGSRLRTPASFPPSLTTEQLPSACGWCHQPPQGTRTPELLIMSCVLPARRVPSAIPRDEASSSWPASQPLGTRVDSVDVTAPCSCFATGEQRYLPPRRSSTTVLPLCRPRQEHFGLRAVVVRLVQLASHLSAGASYCSPRQGETASSWVPRLRDGHRRSLDAGRSLK